MGIARTGGLGEHTSGDLVICFATGNPGILAGEIRDVTPPTFELRMLPDARISTLFEAVVEATEEAIVSAMLCAETLIGRDGVTAHPLPGDRLLEILDHHDARSRPSVRSAPVRRSPRLRVAERRAGPKRPEGRLRTTRGTDRRRTTPPGDPAEQI